METVKPPKKFRDICDLIRNGQTEEGLEKLATYNELEHQKWAVLAEVAYFDGDFETALDYDKQVCPFWDEWHYSNVRSEHLAAMAFAAGQLGKQAEYIAFFEEQAALVEAEEDIATHLKKAKAAAYQNKIEQLQTGIVPHFTQKETYQPPEAPLSLAEIEAILEARIKAKKDKPKEHGSPEWKEALYHKSCTLASPQDMLALYDEVKDNNLSTMWHLYALSAYNYEGDSEKAREVVLRMAAQRLWYVAAPTQVRPIEFFTHPSIFAFLSKKEDLQAITKAACGT